MSDSPYELVVVGGGNMGAALLGGIVDSGTVSGSIAVVELIDQRRSELAARFPTVDVVDTIPSCAAAIIAVKPAGVADAVRGAVVAGAGRVLSIAAGVTTERLDAAAADGASSGDRRVAVVRAMPNTPALVRRGAAAICPGAHASDDDLEWAARLLRAVGTVDVLREDQLDAFTGVIGSGPAYVFLLAESLTDAAIDEGIARDVAERAVRQLFVGASALLDRDDADPATLREQVTSPGGTTAAGLARFDAHDLRGTVRDAVSSATERSRELG